MKDQDLIKSYFNDYYPDNKRYVYNESVGVTAVIFLFLLYLMTKAFSSKNVPVITKRIENDPQIPDTIIKNLENIKKIIIDHNPGKDLKYVFNLLDQIDDNLNLLKKESNMQKTVGLINDQLIKFLEYITELYAEQSDERKTSLFNELNKVLHIFGLSDIFEKLLKAANDNKQIKNDNKQTVVLNQSDIDGLLSPEERDDVEKLKKPSDQDDEEEEEEEEENLLDDEDDSDLLDEEDNEEDKEILKNITIEQIKLLIIEKRNFIKTSTYKVDIVEPFEYIIDNIKDFDDDDLKQLYLSLYKAKDNLDYFQEKFVSLDIYDVASESIKDQKNKEKNLSEYERLLQYFKKKQYFLKEYSARRFFLIKIDLNDYKFGTITPMLPNDNSDFYYLLFLEEDQEFEINIDGKYKENYKLYTQDLQLKIFKEEIDINALFKTYSGYWKYSDDLRTIKFSGSPSKGFPLTKIKDVSKINKTFIGKELSNITNEISSDSISSIKPMKEHGYYYFIKTEDDFYFAIKIKKDFLIFLKQIYNQGHFTYLSYGGTTRTYTINPELKELILIDISYNGTGKKKEFIKGINQNLISQNDKEQFTGYFLKVNQSAIKNQSNNPNLIRITMTGNWYNK